MTGRVVVPRQKVIRDSATRVSIRAQQTVLFGKAADMAVVPDSQSSSM